MPFPRIFRRKQQPVDVESLPQEMVLSGSLEPLELQAKAAGKRLPRVRIVANTGREPMRLEGFPLPVVMDLQGVAFRKTEIPVVANHNESARIGHTINQQVTPNGVTAEAVVSSSLGVASSFVKDLKAGFPFEVSVGATVDDAEVVGRDEQVTVNGEIFDGPLIVARKSTVFELSIVTRGADSDTSVSLAARAKRSESAANQPSFPPSQEPEMSMNISLERIQEVNAIFAKRPLDICYRHFGDRMEELRASAIAGAVSIEDADARLQKLELEARRAEYPTIDTNTPPVHVRASGGLHPDYGENQLQIIEAALAKHSGLPNREKEYPENILAEADHIECSSLFDAARLTLRASGHTDTAWNNRDAVIRAAFSSAEFGQLLSNIAEKRLLQSYRNFPSAAKMVAKNLPAINFKEHVAVRLGGDLTFDEIPTDGTIKHGMLTDQFYSYTPSTWAKMIGISRKEIINDDTGALGDIPALLGRGAAQTVEQEFWKLVLSNQGSFFAAGNSNLITGSSSALSIDSLGSAAKAMMEQVSPNGVPIAAVPKTLIVPPALHQTALQLVHSEQLMPGGGNNQNMAPQGNPWHGRLEVGASPYIGASQAITGSSDTAWYLFSSPADVPAVGLAFMSDGVPVVEQFEMTDNVLGMKFRAYVDFAPVLIDTRGVVKSAGA